MCFQWHSAHSQLQCSSTPSLKRKHKRWLRRKANHKICFIEDCYCFFPFIVFQTTAYLRDFGQRSYKSKGAGLLQYTLPHTFTTNVVCETRPNIFETSWVLFLCVPRHEYILCSPSDSILLSFELCWAYGDDAVQRDTARYGTLRHYVAPSNVGFLHPHTESYQNPTTFYHSSRHFKQRQTKKPHVEGLCFLMCSNGFFCFTSAVQLGFQSPWKKECFRSDAETSRLFRHCNFTAGTYSDVL